MDAAGQSPSGRWSEDAHAGDDRATTYAVHDRDEEGAGPDTVTVRSTQQFALYALALFALYPTVAYVALSPTYPLTVDLVGAACGAVLVGYPLTVPELSLVTFGAWPVLAPPPALTVVGRSPWTELLTVLTHRVPFSYAVVVAHFTRPT
ncbi:hypothetical protein BRD18_00270 [Halobacteriales archaeon SW_7_71_33]|nr:MAG: hypothetical protein BRD18_00270 [Halobacteriales archaeon SW_7_71_33]